MLLQHLVIRRLTEIEAHPKYKLLIEDANLLLHAAVAAAKSDRSELEKFDLDLLSDVVTTVKLMDDPNFKQVVTKHDIGVDPRDSVELLKMLDDIPSEPTKNVPVKIKDFVRSVALMSKSTKARELESLRKLFSKNVAERHQAIEDLHKLAVKLGTK